MMMEFFKFNQNDFEMTKLQNKFNVMNENDQLDFNLQFDLDLIKNAMGAKMQMN